MLVISRKEDESVVLVTSDGPIVVRIKDILGSRIKLGITAPPSVQVSRFEKLSADETTHLRQLLEQSTSER